MDLLVKFAQHAPEYNPDAENAADLAVIVTATGAEYYTTPWEVPDLILFLKHLGHNVEVETIATKDSGQDDTIPF